jgi:hypothetical protein
MGASDYLGLVRGLPRPTWEQTFRFARFVAGSHSWYKHLPLDRKVPFSFYLDPHVGESLVIKPTGERTLFEITDESTRWHYAWQTTATFRRRFGRWNDFITYGRPFDVASDGRAVSTERRGPEVMGEDGAWLRVTPGVIEAGAAQINAFVHPGAWYAHQWDLGRVEAAVKHWLSPSPPDIQGDLEPADGRFSAMIEERLRRMIPEADSPVCWEWRGYD